MSAEPEERGGHELRSYGRRRGRKPSPAQARLWRDLLPAVRIDISAPPPTPLGALVPLADGASSRAVWLEIGFGGGEHLVEQARRHPDVALIGAEPFEDGVIKVLARIAGDGLGNIRLHPDDVRPLLRWLPPCSVSRAFILFPDPWPKARHRRRRLVNEATLAELARAMVAGGELRLATDIGDYARTMLASIRCEGSFSWTAKRPADWRIRPADWPETRYEQKAGREGRRCYFLSFHRK
jgi:tRNA (guanine-N7-)-methyltransferase